MAVRRVRRIIRKVDPWTVLKASLIFNAIVGLVFVLGMWVMWSLVLQKGIPEKIVDLFDAVTIELTIDGPLYFRITTLLAGIGVIGMTAFMTLGAVIYNLISDLVGGVEVTVLEESYNVAQQQQQQQAAPRRTFSWKPRDLSVDPGDCSVPTISNACRPSGVVPSVDTVSVDAAKPSAGTTTTGGSKRPDAPVGRLRALSATVPE